MLLNKSVFEFRVFSIATYSAVERLIHFTKFNCKNLNIGTDFEPLNETVWSKKFLLIFKGAAITIVPSPPIMGGQLIKRRESVKSSGFEKSFEFIHSSSVDNRDISP